MSTDHEITTPSGLELTEAAGLAAALVGRLAVETSAQFAALSLQLKDTVVRRLPAASATDLPAEASPASVAVDLARLLSGVVGVGPAPLDVLLATASAQDIAVRLTLADAGAEAAGQLSSELAELATGAAVGVHLAPCGPYVVTGGPGLVNHLGEPVDSPGVVALCRCGESAVKPACDGACVRTGWSDEKSADRVPDRRDTYPGVQVTVFDNRGICQHAGFCTDRLAVGLPPGPGTVCRSQRGQDGRDHPRRAGLPVRGTQLCHRWK